MLLIVSSLRVSRLRGSLFLPSVAAHLLAAPGALLIFNQFWSKGLIFCLLPIILWSNDFDNYCEYTNFGLSTGGDILRTTYADRAQMSHVLAALMPQNRVVVRVCMATGLRVSDVLRLRTSELKRRQTVRESKTGKTRRIQWPADLYDEMERGAGKYWVFEGRTNPKKHRQRQTVWRDIKRAEAVFKRSGTLTRKQNLGTHTARKVAAVNAYRRGGLDAAQRLLNHSDPLITRLYALADKEIMP